MVLSTVAFVQISSMLRGGDGVGLIAGLALGTVVAGVIVRARGWRDWLAVGVRVVAAQLLVGVVVVVFIVVSLALYRGV